MRDHTDNPGIVKIVSATINLLVLLIATYILQTKIPLDNDAANNVMANLVRIVSVLFV